MDWMALLIDVITAVIILVVGWIGIKIVKKILQKVLEKSNFERSLISFLLSVLDFVLKLVIIIIALSTAGIDMTSFTAILFGLTTALGLALKDNLSNFASGAMILFFKQFKSGDFISFSGGMGTVQTIEILNTTLLSPDNKVLIVPNNQLTTNVITNFSKKDFRRVDMIFGVGYDDDIDEVKKILQELVKGDERILNDPTPPIVVLDALADSSLNFKVRFWLKSSDNFAVQWDLNEKVKKAFDSKNVNIPYPQMDVHLFNADKKEG